MENEYFILVRPLRNYALWGIEKALNGVTHKMLSMKLKELEKDGLIIRHEYPQVPPKVDYMLSEKGLSLMPVLRSVCLWGHEHFEEKQNSKVVL